VPERHIPGVETLNAVRVGDVMSAPIVTCRTEDAIVDVARTMSGGGIHCVVVVGDDGPEGEPGRPWRILSDADLVAAAPFDLGGTLAGWIAGTPIRTIDVDEPLQHAALLMSEDGAAHLIAVDGGRPVGVVSALDVVRALVGGPARA
jgi:CBS domain-containing protein